MLDAGRVVRRGAADVAFAAAAVVFAWPSLLYPFGRDQGLYYYVGREWALRGAIPYRDVFDHKTPGIYVIHAVCVLLFGEGLWGIRLAEIACVLGIGAAAGALTAVRGARPIPGVRGFGCLVASVMYFGFLTFNETGEGEIWLALFAILACVVALRAERERRAQLGAGALVAAALLMKPSAIAFLPIVLVALGGRVWAPPEGRSVRVALGAVWLGLGALAILAPVLAYFGGYGALPAMIDIVVRANRYYVAHEDSHRTLGEIVAFTWGESRWYEPITAIVLALWVAGVVVAHRSGDGARVRRHLLGAALCLAAWAGVIIQAKFYRGHWGVLAGPVTVVITNLGADVVAWVGPRTKRAPSWTLAGVAALCVVAYACTGAPLARHLLEHGAALDLATGTTTRDQYLAHFEELGLGAPARDNEAAGRWVREHSRDTDLLAVRGFQPQVYATARRRCPGRFFWTTFIVSPGRLYKREEWLAEDREALEKSPPRHVVALSVDTGNSDGAPWWLGRGYSERARFGDLVVLERVVP